MFAGEGSWKTVLFFSLQATSAYSHAAALGVSNQDQGVFPTVLGLY